ncbi:MAG: LysR family transcriptional regulator [Gammaproteobacteria bacterium]|nr:LysR family transcriptional regulator [Gammaproteobacteria bacterium]NNM21370.1 LysR family transcriptional regulator [Gammaproteobacteria bacterium]
MDLELLRTFLELNRTRHFGRSAEALNVTQAAVSSRLKNLEQQLGSLLFERSRREMRLTPEGSRLVPHAQRLIAAWRAARQDVTFAGAAVQLVIGGSLRLWDAVLQRWLHEMRRTWPEMAIIAESQTPDVLTRQLIDGTLDVAIMLEPAQLEIMHIRETATLQFVCVSSSAGVSIETALGDGYVYVDWGLSFALDHRRTFPDAVEARTRASHAKMALEYINAVGGSAYLPLRMVEKDLEFGLLHRVEDAPVFERQAYATFPVRSPRLELIEQALELIPPTLAA